MGPMGGTEREKGKRDSQTDGDGAKERGEVRDAGKKEGKAGKKNGRPRRCLLRSEKECIVVYFSSFFTGNHERTSKYGGRRPISAPAERGAAFD